MSKKVLSIYKCIGKGYARGWWTNCKVRYRAYKGARNTKKSVDIMAYEIIDKILTDPRRNVLIIRQTFASHRTSTYARLKKIISHPDINDYDISLTRKFKFNKTDLTITYIPTGQVILFRGMDDSEKLASIEVEEGFLTDVYIEEAFELKDYDAWRVVDGSIRGKLPEGLFHQITFCFNAWNKNHWLYEKFFKGNLEDDFEYLMTHDYQDFRDDEWIGDYGIGLYLHISTYKINEFRDKEIYDRAMEELYRIAIDIFKVEALGMWGNASAKTYNYWNDDLIITTQQVIDMSFACTTIGIDIGMGNGEGKKVKNTPTNPNRVKSAMTMELTGVTDDFSKLVPINEYFYSNENSVVKKTSIEVASEMIETIIKWKKLYKNNPTILNNRIIVYVESADPGGFINVLQAKALELGLTDAYFITATKNAISLRVDFEDLMMAYKDYLVCDQCPNLIREIRNSRQGDDGSRRADGDDHAINAGEYSWIPLLPRIKRWKDFKKDGR